jgi:hypothetical protein
MLLPALSSAKNRAQQVTDLNNNKQLLLSAIMYSGDNNEKMADAGWATPAGNVTCWAYSAPVPGGSGGNLTAYNTDLPGQINAIHGGQLFPYIKTEKVFKCPADNKMDSNFFARKIQVVSYVWNGAIDGYASGQTPSKITAFKPEAILQWETDENYPAYFNDCTSFPDEGISSRHGKGATVGLFSGVTQKLRQVTDWYQPTMAGTRGQRGANCSLLPNPCWCNPRTANGLP